MAKKKTSIRKLGTHFLRQWREYRGLTLARLAERIGTSGATLSRIERSLQPYNQPQLEAIADELRCAPDDLLRVDPRIGPEIEILSLYREAPAIAKRHARAVLKSGTED